MSQDIADRRIPAAGQVRARMRSRPRWRPSWQSRVAAVYERGLYAAVFGGLTYQLVTSRIDGNAADVPVTGTMSTTAIWLSVIAAVVLVKCLLALGPVFAGPSRIAWLLGSPVDRRGLLLGSLALAAVLGLVIGGLWPVALLGVLGPVVELTAPLLITSAAMGLAVTAAAVVVQRSHWRRSTVQLRLSWVLVVAVSGLLVTTAIGQPGDGWAGPPRWAFDLVTGLSVLLAGLATVAAFQSLGRIRRDALSAGSDLVSVTAVSVSTFDFALLGSVLTERRARATGRVRSARLRGPRTTVLVATDVLRVVRNRTAMLVWAALIPIPVIVDLGPAGELAPALHLVAAFLATDRLAGGLRFVCRSDAMRRMLGVPTTTLRLAHLVVPATGAAIWCAVTLPLMPGLSMINALVSTVGAVAVVYRIATRPPLDYSAAAYDFGALGSTPVGLILQLARGPALLIVLAWVQVALPQP